MFEVWSKVTRVHRILCSCVQLTAWMLQAIMWLALSQISAQDRPMLGQLSRPCQWQAVYQSPSAHLRMSQSVLAKASAMADTAGSSMAQPVPVPQTWSEANALFVKHPSAAVPLAGIALVSVTRLQQPLTLMDAAGDAASSHTCEAAEHLHQLRQH